jgi:hypothetical protein
MAEEHPTCDVCGKPVNVTKDGRYTLADEWDGDRLVRTRHVECTAAFRMRPAQKGFDEASRQVLGLLDELRRKL